MGWSCIGAEAVMWPLSTLWVLLFLGFLMCFLSRDALTAVTGNIASCLFLVVQPYAASWVLCLFLCFFLSFS